MESDQETELDYEDDLSSLPDPHPFQHPPMSEFGDSNLEVGRDHGNNSFGLMDIDSSSSGFGPTKGFRGRNNGRGRNEFERNFRGRGQSFNRAPGGHNVMHNQDASDQDSMQGEDSWYPIGRPAKRQRTNDPNRGNYGKSFRQGQGDPYQRSNAFDQARNPWRDDGNRQPQSFRGRGRPPSRPRRGRFAPSIFNSRSAMEETRRMAVGPTGGDDGFGIIHNIIEDDDDNLSLISHEDEAEMRQTTPRFGVHPRSSASQQSDDTSLDLNEIISAMSDQESVSNSGAGPLQAGYGGADPRGMKKEYPSTSRGVQGFVSGPPLMGFGDADLRNMNRESPSTANRPPPGFGAPRSTPSDMPFRPKQTVGERLAQNGPPGIPIPRDPRLKSRMQHEAPWMKNRSHWSPFGGDSEHSSQSDVFSLRSKESEGEKTPLWARDDDTGSVGSAASDILSLVDDNQYCALKDAVQRLKEINKLEIMSSLADRPPSSSAHSATTDESQSAQEGGDVKSEIADDESMMSLPGLEYIGQQPQGQTETNVSSSPRATTSASSDVEIKRSPSGVDQFITIAPSEDFDNQEEDSGKWPPVLMSQPARQNVDQQSGFRGYNQPRGDFGGSVWDRLGSGDQNRGGPNRGGFNRQFNRGGFNQQFGGRQEQMQPGIGMGFMGRGNRRGQRGWRGQDQGQQYGRGGGRNDRGRFQDNRGRFGGHQDQDDGFKRPHGRGGFNRERGRGNQGGRGRNQRGGRGGGGGDEPRTYFPNVFNSSPPEEDSPYWDILPDDDSRIPKTEDGMPLTFADYFLKQEVIKALDEDNVIEPTRLQHEALPELSTGVDICLYGESGSGKTLAHALAVLQQIDANKDELQAMVVCPYRERVTHIESVYESCSRYFEPSIKICMATGGSSYKLMKQRILQNEVQVLIGTYGKLCMLLTNKVVKEENVRILVVEELSVVFKREPMVRDLNILVDGLKHRRQFIATVDESRMFNKQRVFQMFENGRIIDFGPRTIVSVLKHFTHMYCITPDDEKDDTILKHLKTLDYKRVAIRCRDLGVCNHVEDFLKSKGVDCLMLDAKLRSTKEDGTGRRYQDYIQNAKVVIINKSLGFDNFDLMIIYDGNKINAMHYSEYMRQMPKNKFASILVYLTNPAVANFYRNFDRNLMEVKQID